MHHSSHLNRRSIAPKHAAVLRLRGWLHFGIVCILAVLFSAPEFNVQRAVAQEKAFSPPVLSAAEMSWLARHPDIGLAIDTGWAPFEFVGDDGVYKGMAAEYIRLVEERLGIRLRIDTKRTWPEMVEAVKAHELDAFSLVVETPKRDEYLNFTKPYISFPMVIVALDTEPYIDGIAALRNLTVSVVESYASHELLVQNHPDLKIRPASSVREGLEAVSNGQAHAFIGNLAVASQVIREAGITNLKISGQTPYRFELSMAVRKDWPELIPILQKGLDSITPAERDAIYNRWIRVKYRKDADYRIVLAVVLIGAIVLGVILVWNRKLKSEIHRRHAVEASLDHERRRFKEIIESTNVGTWEWNVQSGETEFNDRWAEIIGYSLDELKISVGDFRVTLTHPVDLVKSRDVMEDAFRQKLDHYECEIRMRHKKGHWVWIRDRGKVVEWGHDGRPLRVSGTHSDITERKKSEARLQLAASVFTSVLEGIAITDPDGIIIDVNDAFSRITGHDRPAMIGQDLRQLNSVDDDPEFYDTLWRELQGHGKWSGEIWKNRKNGDRYAETLTISTVRDDNGIPQHHIVLVSDVTGIKDHQRQLESLAHFDALTGLPNRVLLADRLRTAMARAQRQNKQLAVAYIDLDGFKAVNDTHGHEAGDELLISVSARMQEVLREVDTLSRLGGDEFVAVLTDLEDPDRCGQILDRLLATVGKPVDLDGISPQVSASIGVTFFPQPENVEPDQLMRQADQAMYQAKLTGKNRYHLFDGHQDRVVKDHHENLFRARRALARNAFELYFQPVVNMQTGEIASAEALLRWNDEERGLLTPGEFRWALDDHPLAVDLGEWVIDAALARISAWQAVGLSVPVSINVGVRHLGHEDFAMRLKALLTRHPDVKPDRLTIEVAGFQDLLEMPGVVTTMGECRAIGVHFALDDFGVGHASLKHLEALPVTEVKTDRSLVAGLGQPDANPAVLQGILSLANAFDVAVTAKGVETPVQGRSLAGLKCESAQGYAIAYPMPADAFCDWARSWNPDRLWSNAHPGVTAAG